MSIRKVEPGDTWYCDGADLAWEEDETGNGHFILYSVEGDLYNDEDTFHWGYDKNNKQVGYHCYKDKENEPTCPHCLEPGLLATDIKWGISWIIECNCHNTPVFRDPFDAWDAWIKYIKKEKELLNG